MSRTTRFLAIAYRCLLCLYPASFRAEFSAEMQQVFRQALADASRRGRGAVARLCLRELQDWPAALGREWASSLRDGVHGQKGVTMEGGQSTYEPAATAAIVEQPAPWGQAVLAVLALLIPGLAFALRELPALSPFNGIVLVFMQPAWRLLLFGSYLVILLGILAGWLRGFPRWSYPYAGYGLLYALYLSQVSTPGLQLLGYTFARHEVWGWRAWLGLGAVALLALLLTRSLRPLISFFTGAWCDWTRLSFALFGGLPLVLWLLFDEVHPPYPAPFLAIGSLCLAGGALFHMRSGGTFRRVLSLLAGLAASWLISTAALSAYWHGPRVPGRPPFHWSGTAVPMAVALFVVAIILLIPLLLGLLRRVLSPRRPA